MGHYLGSLLPYTDQITNQPVTPKFAQIYTVDPDMQQRTTRRRGIFSDLCPVALGDIEAMMAEHNPLAQQFLTFGERLRDLRERGGDIVDVRFRLHENRSRPGTYNLPTVSEVGATMIEDGNLDQPRDIILYAKDHRLFRLFETHATYDPLQYPLLLPYGELGWTYTDTYDGDIVRRNKREMSLREHVAYRLYQKCDDESVLHQGGRLFQQYCVDQRAKCEQEQLRWVAAHQSEIRADLYSGLNDSLMNESTTILGEGEALLSEYNRSTRALQHPDQPRQRDNHFLSQIGKRVILPPSHSGGPRSMYKSYQASMTIVREYGKPDAFVIVTCSPTWEEIMEKIPNGQTAQDRPDIVARVWQLKIGAELKDLDEGVLRRVHARIYVVEFQKRGLPHTHILVILAEADKPRTRQIIDKMVSAELPDREKNPQLYETVTTCMIHGPCGAAYPNAVCMKDGKCTKGFPKPLSEVTKGNVAGYPVYRRRRRAAGVVLIHGKEYDNETINQRVVPYNPYLSQKYNCHINVEVCTAITAVKYLCKYVYKGSDKAVITVEAVRGEGNQTQIEPNEILRFLNARYISPVEACMRLLDYSVQGKTHAITQLTIHLENEQMVTFRSSDDPAVVVTRGKHTMLTRFFELCASEAPENQVAKSALYQDIPKLFQWDTKAKRGSTCACCCATEKDLRTVDGVTYDSYREAALHAGYLEDDSEWVACMTEASQFRMPYQLRQLFATIIVYSQVVEVGALLEGNAKEEMVKFHTLKSLNDLLLANGSAVAHFEDLPQLCEYPHLVLDLLLQNNLIRREMEGYNHDVLQETVDQEHLLNGEQRSVYSTIINAVDNPTPGNTLFFVDGPGGTGKSTLLKHILAKVRLSGK
ncbi:hypothetical protein PC122_g16436 [Phytophthora cactorum]|nr:hypothetical protein PC122_g16436 [Phytophthora cactorum]